MTPTPIPTIATQDDYLAATMATKALLHDSPGIVCQFPASTESPTVSIEFLPQEAVESRLAEFLSAQLLRQTLDTIAGCNFQSDRLILLLSESESESCLSKVEIPQLQAIAYALQQQTQAEDDQ